jgi:hypothetical protein
MYPENPQINFQKLAYFSAPKNNHPTHHVSPRIHHNFTTNYQHENAAFSKTTLKNASKAADFAPAATLRIFSEN